jgi:hypothetical protein
VIAETIAGKLGIENKSITADEAPQYLGFLAGFAGSDNPVSNDKTSEHAGVGANPPRLGRRRPDGPLHQLTRHSESPNVPTLSASHSRSIRLDAGRAVCPSRENRR